MHGLPLNKNLQYKINISRVKEHQAVLLQFVCEPSLRIRKRYIKSLNLEELKAFVECIINSPKVTKDSGAPNRVIKESVEIYHYFDTHQHLDIRDLQSLLSKFANTIQHLIFVSYKSLFLGSVCLNSITEDDVSSNEGQDNQDMA